MLILKAVSLEAAPRVGHRAADSSGVARRPAGKQGSLYPALHRLERRGLIASEWAASETGRDAKFYRLTAKGRSHLKIRNGQLGAIVGSHCRRFGGRRREVRDGAGGRICARAPGSIGELDAELRHHVERLTEDYLREGLSEAAGPAGARALRAPAASIK